MAKDKIISKDELFETIYYHALGTFSTMESHMHIKGLITQVFGIQNYELNGDMDLPSFLDTRDEDRARHNFMQNPIWYPFDRLYDYSVNGDGNKGTTDEIDDCLSFLSIIDSNHFMVSQNIYEIITMALVRYALERESSIVLSTGHNHNVPIAIAKLANVDLRTFKNAISANEIETLAKGIISTSSLNNWLLKRKDFKPTIYQSKTSLNYEFNSPNGFASLLKTAKNQLNDKFNPQNLLEEFSDFYPNLIEDLELGIFKLPLDSIPLIAKTYGLPLNILLRNIMKTYYPSEYSILSNSH